MIRKFEKCKNYWKERNKTLGNYREKLEKRAKDKCP